eukprot:1952744-Prymnesium_polylepis.1
MAPLRRMIADLTGETTPPQLAPPPPPSVLGSLGAHLGMLSLRALFAVRPPPSFFGPRPHTP